MNAFKSHNNAFLLVNIQILNSFICTDIAWQKRETFKLGSSLARNLKLYLLVNLPPVCFLITQFRQASIEATKGRTNSKWFIQFKPTIPPKNKWTNSFFCLTVLWMNLFVHFWRNSRIPKSAFKINWPLPNSLLCHGCFSDANFFWI